MKEFIFDLQRFADIYNSTSNTLVSGTSGADSIYNSGSYVSINAGAGNDSIFNDGFDAKINGNDGNDSIYSSWGSFSTINAGNGNDSIVIYGSGYEFVNGGAGNDLISLEGSSGFIKTISGGKGNDTVYHESEHYLLYQYASGDGNDIIYDWTSSDTLEIGGGTGTYSSQTSCSDIIVNVGTGKVSLVGAASLASVNITGEYNPLFITLTEGNDTYSNTVEGATINALGGNDYIYNSYSNVSINAGNGNDTVYNYGSYVTIAGGAGNDYIDNGWYKNVSLNGGSGNDTLSIRSDGTQTLTGGAGSDLFVLYYDSDSLYGADVITDYAEVDKIKFDNVGVTSVAVSGNNVVFKAGDNKLTVKNAADKVITYIDSDGTEKTFGQSSPSNFITGTSGADSITNTVESATINALGGNDSIYNSYASVSINAGDGNDTVYNFWVNNVTIAGGNGNDSIYSRYGKTLSINGGTGNDTLHADSDGSVTLTGGAGSDLFVFYYDSDSSYGTDVITDYAEVDKIKFDNATLAVTSVTVSGNNVVFKAGDNKLTVKNAADKLITYIDSDGTEKTFGEPSKLITGTSGADNIYNTVGGATINALGGNDSIYNDYASSVSINAGDGDDTVTTVARDVTVVGGAGNDSIENAHDQIKIYGGTGNDFIYNNAGTYVTIDAGTGNDTINNYSGVGSISINGGAGNDRISLNSSWGIMTVKGGTGNDNIYGDSIQGYGSAYGVLYQYSSGDGNDKIYNWNSVDTLQIGGGTGTYSSQVSGSNIIVTVGEGKITLQGAASVGTYISGDEVAGNEWTFSNSTAKYGTSSNTLITVKGVKSLDGLSLSGNVVTVDKASVNAKKITLSGDGYTLALADGLAPTNKKAAWSYKDGTATYKSAYKTAGYKLASNAKSISYIAATKPSTLATVKGVKSLDGISLSGNVVTVDKASVNAKKITLSGEGYTLALADGLAPTNKKAAWSYSNGTATYKSAYKTAGYKLASNAKSISYTKATKASTLATVKGAKSKTGLSVSGKKITLKNSALSNKVTVSGSGYEFNFASDYNTATVVGSKSTDSITTQGKGIVISSGAGDDTIKMLGTATVTGGDGKDVFLYKSGKHVIKDYKEEDKISIASGTAKVTTSGNNVVFTIGSGKITVTGGKDKVISYSDDTGEHTYPENDNGTKINGKKITLTENYLDATFNLANYDKALQTVDASAVQLDIKITGNNLMNKIVGGNGNDTLNGGGSNDTLKGGNGADVFVWNKGGGNDLITDYKEEDTIKITGDTVKSIKASSDKKDIIFTLASNSKITLTGGADKIISYSDEKGKHIHSQFVKYSGNGKSATLEADYPYASFEQSNYSKYADNLATIDASDVMSDMIILGNGKANSIKGTTQNDTIDGGAAADILLGNNGNDSLYGNAGNDSLVGGVGDDTLWGGVGNDSLVGGAGSNTFIYNYGEEKIIIEDFSPDLDKIMVLSGREGYEGYGFDNNNNVIFNFRDGGQIVVQGLGGQAISLVDSNNETIATSRPIR